MMASKEEGIDRARTLLRHGRRSVQRVVLLKDLERASDGEPFLTEDGVDVGSCVD